MPGLTVVAFDLGDVAVDLTVGEHSMQRRQGARMQALGNRSVDQRAFELLGRALADTAIGHDDAQATIDHEYEFGDRADQLPQRVRLQRRTQPRPRRRNAGERKVECFRSIQPCCSRRGDKGDTHRDGGGNGPPSEIMGSMVLERRCRGYQPLP